MMPSVDEHDSVVPDKSHAPTHSLCTPYIKAFMVWTYGNRLAPSISGSHDAPTVRWCSPQTYGKTEAKPGKGIAKDRSILSLTSLIAAFENRDAFELNRRASSPFNSNLYFNGRMWKKEGAEISNGLRLNGKSYNRQTPGWLQTKQMASTSRRPAFLLDWRLEARRTFKTMPTCLNHFARDENTVECRRDDCPPFVHSRANRRSEGVNHHRQRF